MTKDEVILKWSKVMSEKELTYEEVKSFVEDCKEIGCSVSEIFTSIINLKR